MTHALHHRLRVLALASLAGLLVAAAPASATDDPAPGLPPAGAAQPAPPASSGAPAKSLKTRAGKLTVRLRYRSHCKGVRVSVSGAGSAGLKRVDIRAGGKRIGRDRSRPYRVVLGSKRLKKSRKLTVRLVGSSSTRTVKLKLRACSSSSRVSANRSAFEPLPVALALDSLLGSSFTNAT